MKPSDVKLALPWSNVADKDLPNFEPHPDFPGEFLHWYRLPCGLLAKIPAPFPRFDYDYEEPS